MTTISYQENYDWIADVHLQSVKSGQGNPWMPADVIEAFHRATIVLIERYTGGSGRVLDAGCGIGELCQRMDSERFDLVGIDISSAYLRHARERSPGVRFVHGKLEKLPFPAASFDMVVATDVLEHVLHLDDVLRELLRVLKPGGHLIARVPVEPSIGGYLTPNPFPFVHVRRFDEADLVLLFTRCFACEVLETPLVYRPDGSPPPEIHAVVRKP